MIKLIRNSDQLAMDLFKVNKQNPNVEYCSARAYKIDMKIIDYIGFGKEDFNINENVEILNYFGIDNFNQKLNEIDRNKRQIIHLIASIITDKQIYYFVEPTINLEVEDIEKFLVVVSSLAEMDKEVILMTDDIRLINQFNLNSYDLIDNTNGFVVTDISCEELPFIITQKNRDISRTEICKVLQTKLKLYLNLLFFVILIMLFVTYVDISLFNRMVFDGNTPANMAYIKNNIGNCDYNQMYDAELYCGDHNKLEFSQIEQLLANPNVKSMYIVDYLKVLENNVKKNNGEIVYLSLPTDLVDKFEGEILYECSNVYLSNPTTIQNEMEIIASPKIVFNLYGDTSLGQKHDGKTLVNTTKLDVVCQYDNVKTNLYIDLKTDSGMKRYYEMVDQLELTLVDLESYIFKELILVGDVDDLSQELIQEYPQILIYNNAIEKQIRKNINYKYYVYIAIITIIFLMFLVVINQFRKSTNDDLEAEYIRYFSVVCLDKRTAKICGLQINLLLLAILWICGTIILKVSLFGHQFIILFHLLMVLFAIGKIIDIMKITSNNKVL